jgi:putative transposase
MKDLLILLAHLLTTIAKLLGPGGAKTIVADSLLMKQQLLIMNRTRRRAPTLSVVDRFLLGFWSLFLSPRHIQRAAVIIRPSTLLKLHRLLKQRKYRWLYSAGRKGKPGPKDPSPELIQAIIELKRRNPRFGCPRIVQQINKAFGTDTDKDVVRRILATQYRPDPDGRGPSWLTFLGHTKDSLWSIDLFRCESILLKSYWVLVVMDQFTRRIIGFGVHAGNVDGIGLCRMFNAAISVSGSPKYLSSDNDPLFQYHRWQANLRILEIQEIKSIPYVPLSHPFVERLIGTVRREFLDQTLFWNASDLERKLVDFRQYYNTHRSHTALDGTTPVEVSGRSRIRLADLSLFQWESHCRGLYQLPVAAKTIIRHRQVRGNHFSHPGQSPPPHLHSTYTALSTKKPAQNRLCKSLNRNGGYGWT